MKLRPILVAVVILASCAPDNPDCPICDEMPQTYQCQSCLDAHKGSHAPDDSPEPTDGGR